MKNKVKQSYIKSPFHCDNDDFKRLSYILSEFPVRINSIYDVFAGNCNFIMNVNADVKFANDTNAYLIDIYHELQKRTLEEVYQYLKETINYFKLSRTHKKHYQYFLNYYNSSDRNPLDLLVLLMFSKNFQFNFDKDNNFRDSYSYHCFGFGSAFKKVFATFYQAIQSISFFSLRLYELKVPDNCLMYFNPPCSFSKTDIFGIEDDLDVLNCIEHLQFVKNISFILKVDSSDIFLLDYAKSKNWTIVPLSSSRKIDRRTFLNEFLIMNLKGS